MDDEFRFPSKINRAVLYDCDLIFRFLMVLSLKRNFRGTHIYSKQSRMDDLMVTLSQECQILWGYHILFAHT